MKNRTCFICAVKTNKFKSLTYKDKKRVYICDKIDCISGFEQLKKKEKDNNNSTDFIETQEFDLKKFYKQDRQVKKVSFTINNIPSKAKKDYISLCEKYNFKKNKFFCLLVEIGNNLNDPAIQRILKSKGII